MNLSSRAKILAGIGLAVAVLGWLVLLDYGLNAGRIHYGVHVRGVDVGGMTVDEARQTLREHGSKLRKEEVVLSAEGMNCSFEPSALGWRPRPNSTAHVARAVGFRGGLLTDLRDRLQTWFTGVEVDWADRFDVSEVEALVSDCERQAEALHLELDRARLKRLIGRAIATWPRRIFQIPVSPSS